MNGENRWVYVWVTKYLHIQVLNQSQDEYSTDSSFLHH
ncbi:unnamed protein product [Schistosoma curassoni]|uniref:Uncharacterized protein n=1 Tax=Schistosoma curassoni TaxID=6186 RepID=A0A183KBW9_9TREM|nr:unnamed protein product [Schistosoma curassoni]